jgi:hypothetical protein
MLDSGMPARLKTPGGDHSTRGGPLQLHYGVIDIGPHGIATYGPARNWHGRSGRRPATQGLPKPVLGLSLEAVNGHRQRLLCDGSSKPPWGGQKCPRIFTLGQCGEGMTQSWVEHRQGCNSISASGDSEMGARAERSIDTAA